MSKLFKTLVVIGLIGVAGVASAALVSHLSNAVSVNADISSPFTMSINAGRDGSEGNSTPLAIKIYSGSDFTFTTVAKNNSDTDLKDYGYRVFVATAPYGQEFTGGEITKVLLENAWTGGSSVDITEDLYVVSSNGSLKKLTTWTGASRRLVIITSDNGTDATKNSLVAGESDWNAFTMTTSIAIQEGLYKIESQLVYELSEYATYQYGL